MHWFQQETHCLIARKKVSHKEEAKRKERIGLGRFGVAVGADAGEGGIIIT